MARRNSPFLTPYWAGPGSWPNAGGKVFYVGATAAPGGRTPSNGNSGLTPQDAFSTIQQGLDSCMSGRGDIVAVLPGSYTVTAALTMTKNDVTLCGAYPVSRRQKSPAMIVNATDDNTITVNADRCKIVGLSFDINIASATADTEVIQLNSTNSTDDITGAQIINCWFDMAGCDTDISCIRVGLDANDAAIDTVIRGCTIYDCSLEAVAISTGSVRCIVEDCWIFDDGTLLTNFGVKIVGLNATVRGCLIASGYTADDTGGCVYVGVAAANALVLDNHIWARGANTIGCEVIATATVQAHGNFIGYYASANEFDFLTTQTSPSAVSGWGSVSAANPAAPDYPHASVT